MTRPDCRCLPSILTIRLNGLIAVTALVLLSLKVNSDTLKTLAIVVATIVSLVRVVLANIIFPLCTLLVEVNMPISRLETCLKLLTIPSSTVVLVSLPLLTRRVSSPIRQESRTLLQRLSCLLFLCIVAVCLGAHVRRYVRVPPT